MGEATGRKCLKNLSKFLANDDELKAIFQRKMTRKDAICVTELHKEQHDGVCGMIRSLDCLHVLWQNCQVAWQGQQTGRDNIPPTIVMDAMCDYNLWFWHHSFGLPGSLNDISIWDHSSLLKSFWMVRSHKMLTLILKLVGEHFVVCGCWWTGSIRNYHNSFKLLRSLETLSQHCLQNGRRHQGKTSRGVLEY